jgi:hypothetical protein
LQRGFARLGHEGIGVCGLGDVLWDVDIYYTEAGGDGPVDVRDEIVSLGKLVWLE